MKEASIQTPAQMLMMCEVTRGFPNMYPDFIQMPLGPNFLGNAHNQRANFSFQDGHVKSLKWTQTLGGVGTGWSTFMWFPNTSPFIPYDNGQQGPPSPWLDSYRGNLLKVAPPGF